MEMDRLEHLGIIHKGLTSYSPPIVIVKWKNQNLYRVCSDFHILNEKLVKIARLFCLFHWLCIMHCAVSGNVVRWYASSLLGSYIQQEYYVAVIQM